MSRLLLSLVFTAVMTAAARAGEMPWLTFEGADGPGKGKHIVFITGDEEYRSEESMPAMARILAERHGFKCTVLFAINPRTGEIDPPVENNIPGLDALQTADLMVCFLRFRHLPDSQMAKFVDYVESGRPVIGLRTATHAFDYDRDQKDNFSKWAWRGPHNDFKGGFGRQVLGETWIDHYGGYHGQSTLGNIVPEMKDHPILRGIEKVWAQSHAYKVTELEGDSRPLLMGQPLQGLKPTDAPDPKKPPVPVAWIKTYTGASGKAARVFTTTMGNGDDFKNDDMRRLFVNACFWCTGLEDRITPIADVAFTAPYEPGKSNFGAYKRGLKPIDLLPNPPPPLIIPDHDVQPLTPDIARDYTLDAAFYKKTTFAQNILIASSSRVSDFAHREAAYLFAKVMQNMAPAVARRIRDSKTLCVLVGHDELVSDMPQFSSDKKGKDLDFYNWRNRGFLTQKNGHPTFLFSEEDVMEYEGGMELESILIHEFGHVIQGTGFDRTFEDRLDAAFKNVKAKDLYNDGYAAQRFRRVKSNDPVNLYDALVKAFPAQAPELLEKCLDGGDILVNGKPTTAKATVTKNDKVLIVFGGKKQTYAGSNRAEYWAEGVQDWFDTNRTMDHDHNHIHTRAQLKTYDPLLAKLCEEVLGDGEWRFVSPRQRAGTEHLKGYDVASAPKVALLEHIDTAAQDYYDEYWKTYWKRLYDKYNLTPPTARGTP